MRLKDLRIGDKVWALVPKGRWVTCPHCKNQKLVQTGYRVSSGKVYEISCLNGELKVNAFCGDRYPDKYTTRKSAEKACAKLNRRFKIKGY